MTELQLIRRLNVLFGKDREPLRKALQEARGSLESLDELGDELARLTGQPLRGCDEVYGETWENLDKPKCDLVEMGDASYYYEIVLNQGLASGLDFDERLAKRCKGTVKFCEIWISLLAPYYVIRMFTWTRKARKDFKLMEFHPYRPTDPAERDVLQTIRKQLRKRGYRSISKRLASRRVPRAVTYIREAGEATVCHCLFTDTGQIHDDSVRLIRSKVEGLDVEVSFEERIFRSGKTRQRTHTCYFPSGNSVTSELDGRWRVKQIACSPKSRWSAEDVIVVDVERRVRSRRKKGQ